MGLNGQTSLRMRRDHLAALAHHARRRGVTRSALVREVLAAWLAEHPAGETPPTPSAPPDRARPAPRCQRCGRTVVGPLAIDAARLDPKPLPEVRRWACGLCSTTDEQRHELACQLIESGEALADRGGALWTAPAALAPVLSAGVQLTLPDQYPHPPAGGAR